MNWNYELLFSDTSKALLLDSEADWSKHSEPNSVSGTNETLWRSLQGHSEQLAL